MYITVTRVALRQWASRPDTPSSFIFNSALSLFTEFSLAVMTDICFVIFSFSVLSFFYDSKDFNTIFISEHIICDDLQAVLDDFLRFTTVLLQ